MNKEKMIKWAEALESGQYKQCHGSWGRGKTSDAYATEGFCCLHVALDLEGEHAHGPADHFTVVEDTYGITDKDISNFVRMNDKQKLSFPEIAIEIRKMVEEV